MSLSEGALGLTIRKKNSRMDTNIPSNPRDVQRWLADLPVADLGDSGSKLFHFLYDLNQSNIKTATRLKILELVTNKANEIISSLSEIYIHSPLNSSRKLRSASELVHALASEQVFGYNSIIEDLASDSHQLNSKARSLLPIAAANALNGQGRVQLQRYELYKTIGSKIWKEQNIIYQLSQNYDFFNYKLKHNSKYLHSVKNQFLLNLTLATCNPYQMKHGQVTQAYDALTKISPLIELSPTVTSQSLYAYSPKQDIPPQPSNAVESSDNQWHGLNLSLAFTAVEKNQVSDGGILSLFKKHTKIELGEELKQHILTHWNSIKSRNFIRVNSNEKTDIAVGMAASHHFLVEKNGDALRERLYGTPKASNTFETPTLDLEADDTQHAFVWSSQNSLAKPSETKDAFASIYTPRTAESIKQEKLNKPFQDIKVKKGYEWINGSVRDVSPAGFCIAFENPPSQHVESNELITIQNKKNNDVQYNLGLIRWNCWTADDTFLIGVELISPQATPIRATLDWDYAKPSYHHNGLLLPEMSNIGIDASIALPPLGYRSGQTVAIITPEQEYKIELTKKVIQTDNFVQFHYQAK